MNVKMIWKFRGLDAFKTAKHHLKHLKEFIAFHNIEVIELGTEELSEFHHIAFMVVKKDLVDVLRKQLKPHQGFLVK